QPPASCAATVGTSSNGHELSTSILSYDRLSRRRVARGLEAEDKDGGHRELADRHRQDQDAGGTVLVEDRQELRVVAGKDDLFGCQGRREKRAHFENSGAPPPYHRWRGR